MSEQVTDPYGLLHYTIGSVDDFWCFDYYIHDDNTVTLHAVINSETGHFIQDAEPPMRVPAEEAIEEARYLTGQAIDWCVENDVEIESDSSFDFEQALRKELTIGYGHGENGEYE